MTEIDSIRKIILNKYSEGVPFSGLASLYTMDMNMNGGDMGWVLEDVLMKEVSSTVKNHSVGDIFSADIPSNKWYYVVQKTFDDKPAIKITVLKVKRSQ